VFWAIGAPLLGSVVVVHVVAQILLLTFGGVLFGTAARRGGIMSSRPCRTAVSADLL